MLKIKLGFLVGFEFRVEKRCKLLRAAISLLKKKGCQMMFNQINP